MLDFTARNVAKFVVKSAVHSYTAGLAETTIVDHTKFEEDDFIVKTSSQVIGWCAASQAEPYTSRAVDKIADFIAAKRAKKQNNTTETE